MDLIEKLGGYESAKDKLSRMSSRDRCCFEDKLEFFSFAGLQKALLEYRRTNNIFEVGDYVLRNDGFLSIIRIKSIDKGVVECIRYIDGEPRWSSFVLSEIRHATDEEIKEGRRL